TQRTASTGGSSDVSRSVSDGTISSSGEIRTGDGREFSVAGEGDRTGGTTSISGATGSASIDTDRRPDGSSVSRIEGSEGGSGISISDQGPGRLTLGQSGSGDLYAGRNGNVYKKSDDGWQNYSDGGWQNVDVPERDRSSGAGDRELGAEPQPLDRRADNYSRDFSSLNRDYDARQRGMGQYEQRSRMSGSQRTRGGRGRRR
ncbi:MAG: hypothetical protein V2J20_09100, partial [Wenzhouxiangella sp.]|nr:hypothetical protein [Wenzhouxiangella sp.]